jgi:hypothetical protein
VNYLIDESGNPKLYHANLLKKYHRRSSVNQVCVIDEDLSSEMPIAQNPLSLCHFCVVNSCESDTEDSNDLSNAELGSLMPFDEVVERPSISPELGTLHTQSIEGII